MLGCGHEFHLRCTVQWFSSQQGEASTCPCCRKESGHLDDLPAVGEMDESSGSGSGGGWVEEEYGPTRMIWVRQITGHWEGELVLENQITHVWDPTAAVMAPTEISEGAVAMQRIWRGYQGRAKAAAMAAAVALIKMSQGAAAPAPAPAPARPWEWIAGALDNDPEWEDHAGEEAGVAAATCCSYCNRVGVIHNIIPIDHDRMCDQIDRIWASINAMSDDDE